MKPAPLSCRIVCVVPLNSDDISIAAPVLRRHLAGCLGRLSLVGGEMHLAQKKGIIVRSQKLKGSPPSQRERSQETILSFCGVIETAFRILGL